MSKEIILSPTTVSSKNNSINLNVTLFGYPLCVPCGGHEVAIELYEKDLYRLTKREDCNTDFYINTYTSSSTQQNNFTADFYYVCKNKTEKKIMQKKPDYVEELYGIFYYDFGYINLKNTENKN